MNAVHAVEIELSTDGVKLAAAGIEAASGPSWKAFDLPTGRTLAMFAAWFASLGH